MSGRLAHHFSAILLPCLMLLGMLGLGSQAAGATFRYDPLRILLYEQYPTGILDGTNGGVGGQPFLLDSTNHVRFQVDQIFTPITKVTIRLVITHPHINDLRISLIAPDNTTVVLVNGIGAVGDPNVTAGGGFGSITPVLNYVEFTPSNTPTPPSIMDPRILTGHTGIVLPGLYLPSGNLSAFNGKMNAQANGIWRLKIEDTRDIDAFDQGIFYNARLYITQQGGERIWTGKGTDNLWSNGNNWQPLFGKPDPAQSNALVFPSDAVRFGPVNDFNGAGLTVIHTLAAYPASPFFSVPAPDSTGAVTLSMTNQAVAVRNAWAALLSVAQVGDRLRVANDLTANANGDFRITAINLTTATLTIVRYAPTGNSNATVTASGGGTMTVLRDLGQLEISGAKFSGGGYVVTGAAVTVTDRSQFINTDGINEWAIASAMEAGQVILDSQGTGTLNLTGVWSGPGGFTKTGVSRVVLGGVGTNTYTGNNLVSDGILDLASNSALGSAAGSTVVNGGTVRTPTTLVVNEPITIGGVGFANLSNTGMGALVFVNGGTWTGVTLDPNRVSTLSVLAGAVTLTNIVPLTPAAPVKTHRLTVTCAGTIDVGGSLPTITDLTLQGGGVTFSAVQPNIRDLALTGGVDVTLGAAMTVTGAISSAAAADPATIIGGGGLNLGALGHEVTIAAGAAGANGGANTTNSDLSITTAITNGSLHKKGPGVLRIAGATGVAATVSEGTLAGTGGLGAVTVAAGAVLSPAGTLSPTAVSLAAGSALMLPAGATPQINATGAVSLQGSVLQPYSGTGTTIITAGSVTGEFEGKANGAGITYTATTVTLAGGGGTWAFAPDTVFTVDESAGTLLVTIVGSGATPVLRNFGGGLTEGVDLRLRGAATSGNVTFTIPIIDNFIDSGDQTTTLAIVPQDGSLITNSATLTIIDNDKTDQKKCGFGTGLTVFLLLGFALFCQLRPRRR